MLAGTEVSTPRPRTSSSFGRLRTPCEVHSSYSWHLFNIPLIINSVSTAAFPLEMSESAPDPFAFDVGEAPAYVPTPKSTVRPGPTGTPILPTSVTPIRGGESEEPLESPVPAPPQADLISHEASRAVDRTFPSYAAAEAASYGDEENPFLEGSPALASVPDAKPSTVAPLVDSMGEILLGAAIPYDSQDEEEDDEAPQEFAGDAIVGTWWAWETVATRDWAASKGQVCFKPHGGLLSTWDARGSWSCQGDGEYRVSFADQARNTRHPTRLLGPKPGERCDASCIPEPSPRSP